MKLVLPTIALTLAACAARAPAPDPSLRGTSWRLVDLAGAAPLAEREATISFPEEGRVAGAGSCNRFFGSVQVTGDAIAFSGLGSTKMACPEPIMAQEQRYLDALSGATRYAIEGRALSIWTKGSEKPLRFERQEP